MRIGVPGIAHLGFRLDRRADVPDQSSRPSSGQDSQLDCLAPDRSS